MMEKRQHKGKGVMALVGFSKLALLLSVCFAPGGQAAFAATAGQYCTETVTEAAIKQMTRTYTQVIYQLVDRDRQTGIVSTMLDNGAAKVDLGRDIFQITDADGTVTQFPPLATGRADGDWRTLYALHDGWVYAQGAGYEYIMQLEKTGGRWTVSRNMLLLTGNKYDVPTAKRIAEKLEGTITDVILKPVRPVYSPELGTLLFPIDNSRFDNGKFASIGSITMEAGEGDIVTKKVAVLRDADDRVYTYDGQSMVLLQPDPMPGWLHRPANTSRSFWTTADRVYEVAGDKQGEFHFVPLRQTNDERPETTSAALPDGSLLFADRDGVYQLVGQKFVKVWDVPAGKTLHTYEMTSLADGKLPLVIGGVVHKSGDVRDFALLFPCVKP
jgi:hypothetical protein